MTQVPASSHGVALHAATHKTGGTDALLASDVGAVTSGQAPIADLNLGVLTLLTDVITAIGTVQGKVNTLLAELRTAGLLLP
jgi:hypothetical protein